jgi:hypothetical protein
MIWFTHAKHHGFIRTEEGERLLVEDTGFAPGHLVGPRCAGTRVTFQRVERDDGVARATSVVVEPIVEPRRARRHRS